MYEKIITVFLLVFALIFSASPTLALNHDVAPVEIEHESEINLILITAVTPSLTVSNSTATFRLTVSCISSVNNIRATLQLQQWSNGRWNNFGSSWTATSSTSHLSTNGTRPVEAGRSYRLRVTVVASNNSSSGSATAYSG